jgi:hypothetical protein
MIIAPIEDSRDFLGSLGIDNFYIYFKIQVCGFSCTLVVQKIGDTGETSYYLHTADKSDYNIQGVAPTFHDALQEGVRDLVVANYQEY